MKNFKEMFIETVENNATVAAAVTNVINTLHEKYDKAIKDGEFDIDGYDNAWDGEERPYLFSVYNEFDDLADLIEEETDIDIDEIIHSDEDDTYMEAPTGSRAEFAWWLTKQVDDDTLLNSGHAYEGNVQFLPTEDDMDDMREHYHSMKNLGEMLTDGETLTVALSYCPCGYACSDVAFTIGEAISAFCNSNFGICNNFDENDFYKYWIWVESDNTLLRKEVLQELLSYGQAVDVDGNIAIKSDNLKKAEKLLDDSWYSVEQKDDMLVTDIPFVAIIK